MADEFTPPSLTLRVELELGTEPGNEFLVDAGILPPRGGEPASLWVAATGGLGAGSRLYEIAGEAVARQIWLPWPTPKLLAVARAPTGDEAGIWLIGFHEGDADPASKAFRLDVFSGDWCDTPVGDDATGNTAPALGDLDADGWPDVAMGGQFFDADCNLAWATDPDGNTFATPVSWWAEDESPSLLTRGGHGRADGSFVAWDWPEQNPPDPYTPKLAGALVQVHGEILFAGIGPVGPALLGEDGRVRWMVSDPGLDANRDVYSLPSIVDVDGDGDPEFIYRGTRGIFAIGPDGAVLWGPVTEAEPTQAGWGVTVTTDLDADGTPEVIDQSPGGVELRDGATGALLDADLGIAYMGNLTGPLVADVDGDGSVEIAVLGWTLEGTAVVRIYGPAEGRWARGRPVWHQRAYDITSIRDDGTIVSFPEPSWLHYNSFRYQPPHDGHFADLVPVLLESCAEACDTVDGYVQLSVAAENLGSADAVEGAQLVVYAYTAARGLVELDRATLGETVPAGRRSSSVVFTLDSSDWGDRRVVEVVPAHDDECDWANNRIEPWDDPCVE